MSASDARFWIIVWIAIFLFWGEPDAWDSLHDYVMNLNHQCQK